ncbi:glutamate formimidoyltransferase [Roseisolibacter sp. H3M3-2]|uniref:glutamate formimidoyltransferase n=1 Tax=Roseisolibacter sp. H3M3-2 TaxID=3031323 RepID=UPI0023DA7D6B|nr:glutamate formimidoyltransferase [Roseisolibacter sp. H3M3-2]MDF1503307.1 glutamate formimidoyltransferase [Roseisolibacter sp. H3M3-2]
MKLVECVPNFSEGRRPEVIAAIRDAIAAVDGVTILDVSSDTSHNRTVVTFVAPVATAADAAFAGIAEAQRRIDLREHRGEHPRVGATDVCPFVPLASWGSTMEDCVALARTLGERVGRELGIPVYLYERAATRPDRENLADVRRGEFEGLRDELGTNPARTPDFGPDRIHESAGATVIGARPFLVAYNVYLGPASNLAVAKEVAKAVRGSSGGLRYVKGLGLEVDGQAQVSMNLVDTERTPIHRAFEAVRTEAAAHGVVPTWSELVGLVPERALLEAGARHVQLRGFSPQMLLEHRVREAVQGGASLSGFVADVASASPTPGGGSVAAHAGALGAALAQMVAGLTVGKKKYAAVDAEMREAALRAADLGNRLAALVARDAQAYEAVSAAYKLPKEPEDAASARARAIHAALLGAAEVPLETARAAAEVAELAAAVAERGNSNAVSDAGVAALLAEAAAKGAAYNVRINVASLEDKADGTALTAEARTLVQRASHASSSAQAAVEKAIGQD